MKHPRMGGHRCRAGLLAAPVGPRMSTLDLSTSMSWSSPSPSGALASGALVLALQGACSVSAARSHGERL